MSKSLFKALGMAFNAILIVLAAALGADSAFAMSAVTEVTEAMDTAGSSQGTYQKVDDSKGLPTQMPGVGASESEAVDSGFSAEEIDQAIAEFQAYQTPVEASISALAEKVNVNSYEIIHYRTATPVFMVQTINAASKNADDSGYGKEQTFTLTIGTDIERKASRLLYECKNIYVKEGIGYDEDGNEDGMMALYVLENDRSKVVLKVLNPDPTGASSADCSVFPAKAHLIIGAVAAAESQREVAPDNFEPVPYTTFLQKRIFNIVLTQDWIEGKKKIKFAEEDLRKGALYSYKVNNEITDLIGVQSKFKVEAGRQMGDEFVYTSRGLLRQVNMYYSFQNDKLTAHDLTAIAKMQFTKFSANNVARVFCGQDFIEYLLNMDLTAHKEIKFEDVQYGGLTMKGWKNNFGTLEFVYTPVFDLLGFEKCAFVVDLKNARNYIKRGAKMETVDMREGAHETREAKRDIYSQIYAVALRGYNAMFIGPQSDMAAVGMAFSNITITVTSASALPTTGIEVGVIYYLTADDDTAGFKKGSFVERNEANTAWRFYNGPIQTV